MVCTMYILTIVLFGEVGTFLCPAEISMHVDVRIYAHQEL